MATALRNRAGRYLENVSNYLLASLVDPSQFRLAEKYCSAELIENAWNDIVVEVTEMIQTQHPDMEASVLETGAEFQVQLLRSVLKKSAISQTASDPLQF